MEIKEVKSRIEMYVNFILLEYQNTYNKKLFVILGSNITQGANLQRYSLPV